MTTVLFPGTFDPIHYGHINIAKRAANMFDEVVVAVYAREQDNILFSPEERLSLAKEAFKNMDNISVTAYQGLTVKFAKKIGARAIVRGLRVFSDFEYEFRMALANNRLAPEIDVIALITSEEHTFLSSTTVREISALGGDVSSMVPPHVQKALEKRFNVLGDDQDIVRLTSLRD
ncbi:MAG: pantetheine-phosphate adenylyltransferase [Brevefilum sp.]|nr:pantetheine-phosphate adenylyltransferase [Brevefilum sp.]MDT8381332.1 pantetheine-phosphate adenylyltransferase [Brevefilum sp.]MDW7754277.1 pantetheine-phosphate adenylyltransferase [Brevefilum sp.]